MYFIDSHTHLNADQFRDNWQDVLSQAHQAGVSTIINNASNLVDAEWGIEQAEQSDHICTTAGIHPEIFVESDQPVTQTESDFNNLRRLIKSSKKVVAIGEIGLDYTLDLDQAPKQKQWQLLEPQLQLAVDLGLPVTLHVRDQPGSTDCFTDLISLLKQFTTSNKSLASQNTSLPSFIDLDKSQSINIVSDMIAGDKESDSSAHHHNNDDNDIANNEQRTTNSSAARPLTGVFHCWVGTPTQAEIALSLGFYLSFSGILTYKSADHIVDVATQAPIDRILIETDAPFLTPEPARSKIKPVVNEPKYVIMTAEKLANIRSTTVGVIAESTTQNARHLFKLGAD